MKNARVRILLAILAALLVPACGSGGGGGAPVSGGGSLDPAFGDGGAIVLTNHISGTAFPTAVAADAASLYVLGGDSLSSGDIVWQLEKRSLADGSPDGTFGLGTGLVTGVPAGTTAYPACLAIDSTSMYVAGGVTSGASSAWRIEKRSLSTGFLDAAFGTNGAVTSVVNASYSVPWAIAVDATAVYIVGQFRPAPGDDAWRIEKRLITDGSLVASFGTSGVVSDNATTGTDIPKGIAIDASFMYVVGSSGTTTQWRIEKRQLSDGSLVAGFGTAGVVLGNPGAAQAIAIDSTALYVVGSEFLPASDAQWRIEKRLLSNGSPVAAFGTAGVVTSNPGVGTDIPSSIALDGTFLYVAGFEQVTQQAAWRTEKRLLLTGDPDPAFGSAGAVVGVTSNEGATGIAQSGSSLFIVGSDSAPPPNAGVAWRIEKRSK